MTKRVLLTGVGGSIGAHFLAHIMHNTDWEIIGLDSFRHKGLTDRVAVMLDSHPQWRKRVTIHTHDLTAPISHVLQWKIGQVDYIINLASRSDVDDSISDPAKFIHDNVMIATTMLEFARTTRPHAFVQFSTDEVYGPSGIEGGHEEWSAILPSNPYAASKACQEAIAISYWRSYRVPVIITNTMNNFGELQQSRKYPAMVQRKVMAGEVVVVHGRPDEIGSRYYLHSRNAADAVLFILRHKDPYLHQDGLLDRPDRYNIVGDRRVDNMELAKLIARLLNKPLKARLEDFHLGRPGHDRHYGLCGKKLAALGWKAPREFEESLRSTLEWTAQHPEWQQE